MSCQNGLCTLGEPEAIFDPALLGEWTPSDPKPHEGEEGYFKVERDDPSSKAYRISAITFSNGNQTRNPYVFRAYVTKFGSSFFLDAVLPPEQDRQKEFPRHGIWRIDFKMPEMTIRPLSREFVKDHPSAIRRTVENSPLGIESVTVTATTRELGEFVRKNAHEEAPWKKDGLVLRHR